MTPDDTFGIIKKIINFTNGCDSNDTDFPFNVLFCSVRYKLRETSHTRFLYHLLDHNDYILKSFLEKFIPNFDFYDEKEYIIKREFLNIDLLIESPRNVVIIENKVNNAYEQKEQIDRYVKKFSEKSTKNIFVLYLCRDFAYLPSEYSYKEAKGKCTLLSYSYKEDIRDWGERLLFDCRKKPELRDIEQSLTQYVQYLNIIFNKQQLEMEEKIEDFIKKLIPDTDLQSYPEEMDKLIEKLKQVENVCWNLKYEYEWKSIQKRINEKLSVLQLGELVSMQTKQWYHPEDMGIQFKINDIDKELWVVVSYMKQRYVGIIDINNSDSKDEDLISRLNSILKLDNTFHSTPRYPLWFPVDSNDSLVNEFIKIVNTLVGKDDEVTIPSSQKPI